MKLYYAPAACSLAVHIALREAGVPFELAQVDLATHTLADGSDYRLVSPRGYVPLLELDDGTRHTEGGALLQWVADLDPSLRLIGPLRSARRLAVIEWVTFVGTELHKTFSPWLWRKETAESTRHTAQGRLAARFAELDRHLESHEYLAGEFSVADAYAYAIANWSSLLGLPLNEPHLVAYLARVAARPQVQEALRAEGLLR